MTWQAPDRVAREACVDLLARYGYALDWLDEAVLADVFWPDAAIDYGFYRGDAAGFVAAVMAIERGARRRFHLTTGTVLNQTSDARIAADSVAITQGVRTAADAGDMLTIYFGRYVDAFERRDGNWRIAERTYLLHGANQFTADAALPLGAMHLADHLSPTHRLSLTSRTGAS